MKKGNVILRAISLPQPNGKSVHGAIECKLVPGKEQYNKKGSLAEGLVPAEGNGIYHVAIHPDTNTSSWMIGELVEVGLEGNNFVTEQGAVVKNAGLKEGQQLAGKVSYKMEVNSILWKNLMDAGVITREEYVQRMKDSIDTSVSEAKAELAVKKEERKSSNVQNQPRNVRGIDLSMFAVETPVVNEEEEEEEEVI